MGRADQAGRKGNEVDAILTEAKDKKPDGPTTQPTRSVGLNLRFERQWLSANVLSTDLYLLFSCSLTACPVIRSLVSEIPLFRSSEDARFKLGISYAILLAMLSGGLHRLYSALGSRLHILRYPLLGKICDFTRSRAKPTLFLGAAVALASTASSQISVSELKTFSLEDLMGLEVTSVSRKPEPFYETAGAVSVLTGTEIKQTGARTLADALRYAPGMEVARVDGRTWAITARGFNSAESNKLLVLMDGRTVYTPLFSGVFWDVQDTFFPTSTALR